MDCTRRFIHFIAVVILTIATLTQTTQASNPIKISGGEDHTLVLTENQFVWGCGHNGWYQLGIGNNQDQKTLARVHGPDDFGYIEDINDIAAGWLHSLALDINGSVWSWGWDLWTILIDFVNKSGII